jgi:hypothetical protein
MQLEPFFTCIYPIHECPRTMLDFWQSTLTFVKRSIPLALIAIGYAYHEAYVSIYCACFAFSVSINTGLLPSPSLLAMLALPNPILLVSYPFARRYSLNLISSWSMVSWPICGSSRTSPAARNARLDATKNGFRPAAISSSPAAFWMASRA